jgi:hypothetical protein
MLAEGTSRPEGLPWQVSSYCNGGSCVRVAQAGSSIFLGDSKNPDGPVLSYTRPSWERIIGSIKAGSFDQIL